MKSYRMQISENKILLMMQIAFLLGLSLFYIFNGVFPSLDMLIALSIAALIWRSQNRALLVDLLPFFILLLTFQSLRSFADDLTPASIHITDLIAYEKALFNGVIPAAYFQKTLTNLAITPFLSTFFNVFYMSHFLVPVIMAIVLWYRRKEQYWYFIIGLILLTYAGFVTYFLYPAAPPWWATKYGYLLDQPVTLSTFAYPTLVEFAGPNPVAAMPSLHMAYPTYIYLFCLFVWGKKAAWLIFLPIFVGLSTLYLGHHYVIDLIAGIGYAGLAYLIIFWVNKVRNR